jgi:pantoate kinase
MANISDVHSIIVPAQSPVFSAHTYNEIYGGSAGCTMVLNGVTVNVAAQSSIKIWVNSISGGTGCYLLGEKQNVLQGLTNGYYLG